MRKWLTRLSRQRFPYEPLVRAEISADRLIHNLNEFRKMAPNGSVAPVLKSNAYGHGLLEVAHILKHEQVPFCVVDSYFEAVALRARGFKLPLLVIGYTQPETILRSRLKRVAFTVTSLDTLREIAETNHPIAIHLKIDTGMRRQGILPDEVGEAIDLIHDSLDLILEGLCTHLADAGNADTGFTEAQTSVWNAAVARFRPAFASLKYIHAGATDGAPFSKEMDANVLRLGIGLYGLSENRSLAASLNLLPVMEMKTVVTAVKKLRAGEAVGYSTTFRAEKDMIIATVPVGYYEGIDRRLSSGPGGTARAYFLVGPDRIPCPIVGRVSMNITTIDVTGVPAATIGMPVIVFSGEREGRGTIIAAAEASGTISYEIAVHIPAHLKRIVI
jgi:alanine racemase